MKSAYFLALFGLILLANYSNQASLGDNSKPETESILELLNSLDKSKIIEIGNKIQRQNNENDAKKVEFAKLLSSLDDISSKSSSDNQETKSNNNNKKFSFQNVLQQASNAINNIKPSSQSSSSSNSGSNNPLLNSGLNIPLPILTNIENGLESARNLTDLSLSQINHLINSNNNLFQIEKTSTLKPNNINNIALDQITNIISNLNTNDQVSKDKLNALLQLINRNGDVNSSMISSSSGPNINEIIANITNNDPQLASLLFNLPTMISSLNIDPSQLTNILSSLQVQDPSQLANGILGVVANQTNVNLNDIQNQYNTINDLANNIQNLNVSNLMNLLNNFEALDSQNVSLINVYIDMVSNQTGLTKDQIKSILVLINKLSNLGTNATAEQMIGIFVEFLKVNPDLTMTLFNYIGAQANIPSDQIQNLFIYLPAIAEAASSMNLTQLTNLFLNFAAAQNNLPQDTLQAVISALPQLADAISKMDVFQLIKILCDLVTQNQSINSFLASQLNIDPNQLNNTFGFLCQVLNAFQGNMTNLDQNQIQGLIQQFLTQNPDVVNQFFGTVSSQTGPGPEQIQAILGQISQLASLFTNNFINNTGNPIEFLNALGFFNYTGLTPDQLQSILGAASQLLNTNNITPEQLYDLLANYKINNQTLLSIFIGFLGSQSNLSPNQIQNLVLSLPPFLNAVSNSNSSQVLTLLTYLIYQSMPAPLTLDPNQIQSLLVPYTQLINAASQMSPEQLINYISDPNATLSRDIAQQLKLLIKSISPETYNSSNIENETDVKKLIAILVMESEKKINQQLSSLGIPIENQQPTQGPEVTTAQPPNPNVIDPNLLSVINQLAQDNLNQVLPNSTPLNKQPANIDIL